MMSDNLDLDAVREPLTRQGSGARSLQLDDVPLWISDVNRRPETVRTIAFYRPLENYRLGRNEIVAGTVSPSFISPLQGLQRLEKIMDEYVGGISTYYVTNEPMLKRGLELLAMLKEDLDHLGAEDLHQLQRAWELHHRVWTSESVTRHTLFREETRWPGYYYRADHPKLDDTEWHVFTASRYDPNTGDWQLGKLPVHHIID